MSTSPSRSGSAWFRYASPATFYPLAGRLIPWFAAAAGLLALAVIWSASFAFIRVLAPPLGPVWTATLRVLVAGIALVGWLAATGVDGDLRRHWRAYLLVGLVNSAAPFLLFSWAALTLPASYLVILNAASPMFAAIVAAAWLGERLSGAKLAGLAVGAAGVALVSRAGPIEPTAAGKHLFLISRVRRPAALHHHGEA